MDEYKIEYTDLAKAFSEKIGGLSVLEERVRGEIAEIFDKGLETLSDLMMHSVEIGDDVFICIPKSDTILRVDTATLEEQDVILDKGPFAGFKIVMPIGDTTDDEE
jgi:hypothetical protein